MIEPLNHPVWAKRVRCLASLCTTPMLVRQLQRAARRAWCWPESLTLQVPAGGDGPTFRADGGLWSVRSGAQVDPSHERAIALASGGRATMTYQVRLCRECRGRFMPSGPRQRLCSDSCKVIARNRSAA